MKAHLLGQLLMDLAQARRHVALPAVGARRCGRPAASAVLGLALSCQRLNTRVRLLQSHPWASSTDVLATRSYRAWLMFVRAQSEGLV